MNNVGKKLGHCVVLCIIK